MAKNDILESLHLKKSVVTAITACGTGAHTSEGVDYIAWVIITH